MKNFRLFLAKLLFLVVLAILAMLAIRKVAREPIEIDESLMNIRPIVPRPDEIKQ